MSRTCPSPAVVHLTSELAGSGLGQFYILVLRVTVHGISNLSIAL